MTVDASWWRERGGAAALTALVTVTLGYALIRGLAMGPTATASEPLDVFALAVPTPPPPRIRPVPPPRPVRRPSGRAAPPNLRSRATEVTAPEPVVPPPLPPPVVAATLPGPGADATSGSARVAGPGTGAGGTGDGFGAGGDGDGDGSGAGDRPPVRIRERLKGSDIPDFLERDATVGVRFHVEVDGRVTGCRVTDGSGDPRLDAATCGAIERRFRYRPSRDGAGRPVRSTVVMDYDWIVENLPPPSPRR